MPVYTKNSAMPSHTMGNRSVSPLRTSSAADAVEPGFAPTGFVPASRQRSSVRPKHSAISPCRIPATT